jgi:uncharacterized protein YndB with AHSA1/START domain
MHDEVTVRMAAPVERVWALVSDVTRIGEFSPETFEAEWLGDATGPEVGARFRGHVKRNGRGPTYWAECVVTECVPDRTFAFGVEMRGEILNTWRYDLAPDGDGTAVTESFTLTPTLPMKLYWAVLGWARGRTNRNGMQQTLDRMKTVVEAGPA